MDGETAVTPRPATTASRAQFQQAFRQVPGPVAVVLATVPGGAVRGITCTSATSLSGGPPMATFSVDVKTRFADAVREAGRFSINYLAADRADWARAFARGGASLAALAHIVGSGRSSVPTLSSGTCAVLECRLADVVPGGDHWIVTGTVAHARRQSDAPALLYAGGRYGSFTAGS
jgi:flavin reductase (DIM6/NTAB) family NADH-FMN oxidoreductase RutF